MMTMRIRGGQRRALVLVLASVLAAAVSTLPAGIGNLGLTNTIATSDPSTATLTFNPTITQSMTGLSATAVRDALVAQINDPNNPVVSNNFNASAFSDPADPNAVSFLITTETGGELNSLRVCETDDNFDNAGVSFPTGKDLAVLSKPTVINGNGNYIVRISTLASGTTTQTFNTSVPPNNTAAGLSASIVSSFTASGFAVTTDADNFTFRRPGDMITALRVSSTDTGQKSFCVGMMPLAIVPQIPTLAEVGMLVLVVLMTGSVIWMLRRKGGSASTRS